jgi:hypothetical protein
VLFWRRCSHTGIVNYFSHVDPYLSVGSIIEIGQSSGYEWRCYIGDEAAAGAAPDLETAECCLRRHVHRAEGSTSWGLRSVFEPTPSAAFIPASAVP